LAIGTKRLSGHKRATSADEPAKMAKMAARDILARLEKKKKPPEVPAGGQQIV
jgi:hypothetical protein